MSATTDVAGVVAASSPPSAPVGTHPCSCGVALRLHWNADRTAFRWLDPNGAWHTPNPERDEFERRLKAARAAIFNRTASDEVAEWAIETWAHLGHGSGAFIAPAPIHFHGPINRTVAAWWHPTEPAPPDHCGQPMRWVWPASPGWACRVCRRGGESS